MDPASRVRSNIFEASMDAEELVENFTLLSEEIALLDYKSEVNRLDKAVLLKFFQMETT